MRFFLSLSISIGAAIGLAMGQQQFPVAGAPRLEAPVVVLDGRGGGETISNRIRIAFYNIENFTDGEHDGPQRTHVRLFAQARAAAALINEIDPHILLLAEVENEKALRILNEQLARPFPFGWITRYAGGDGSIEKLQNAILSRFEPFGVLELDFDGMNGPGRPPRGALRILYNLDEGRQLLIYAVHLKSNYGYRPRNMHKRKHALQAIAEDAGALLRDESVQWEVLLVGDLNIDPELPEFADDWSLAPMRGWTDLWLGAPIDDRVTVPTRYGDPAREFPPASFDRIIVAADATNPPWRVSAPGVLKRGVNVRNVFAIPGEDGHVSDHYPVWVDLLR